MINTEAANRKVRGLTFVLCDWERGRPRPHSARSALAFTTYESATLSRGRTRTSALRKIIRLHPNARAAASHSQDNVNTRGKLKMSKIAYFAAALVLFAPVAMATLMQAAAIVA